MAVVPLRVPLSDPVVDGPKAQAPAPPPAAPAPKPAASPAKPVVGPSAAPLAPTAPETVELPIPLVERLFKVTLADNPRPKVVVVEAAEDSNDWTKLAIAEFNKATGVEVIDTAVHSRGLQRYRVRPLRQ